MRFVTDEELLAAGVPDLDVDALNRDVRSQKVNASARDLAGVREVLQERGVRLDHD